MAEMGPFEGTMCGLLGNLGLLFMIGNMFCVYFYLFEREGYLSTI